MVLGGLGVQGLGGLGVKSYTVRIAQESQRSLGLDWGLCKVGWEYLEWS